ncbi:MAG: MFS transporter [Lachnospiraceae bacterium]|nr:MFS transporter [Lachnospiraceae bacterium]
MLRKNLENVFKEGSAFRLFFVSLLLSGLGYGIYKGILDNYLAEIVAMSEFDRGVTEFFRELPGLMLVFILAAFYTFSAEKLYKIGAVIMLLGMGMISLVPATRVLVTLSIFVYSLGEHIQLGMKNTLTLEYSKEGKGGTALGYQSAVYQIGTLFGFLVIMVCFAWFFKDKPYRTFLLVSTALFTVGMLVSLRLPGKSEFNKNSSRFYFKKKFRKYYMLEIFYGARKQVFFTFGPYVLILFYGADASRISMLFAISAVSCYFLAPLVGRIIDRFGYKTVMIADTLILVIVCFFYGFAHHIFPMEVAYTVCCANYVLDSIISLASLASNVYVQDISDSADEMQKTISTGVSVNHMITIFIALFGGLIWQKLGIETLFVLSAVLGLCNSAYAATIRPREKEAGILSR